MTARIDDFLKKSGLSKKELEAFNAKTAYKKNQDVTAWQTKRIAFLNNQIQKSSTASFESIKQALLLEPETEKRNEDIAMYDKFIDALEEYVLKLQSEITWIEANGA